LTQWVLPRLAGIKVDPEHPERVAAAVPQAFAHTAPLFLSARMQPNWGQFLALHGLSQLWPLALIACALLLWRAHSAEPFSAARPLDEHISQN
jgi:hypothetical protein